MAMALVVSQDNLVNLFSIFIMSLFDHKSIRRYTNKPIASDVLNKILSAGVRGSNTGNMQLYSIIVSQDDSVKAKLAPAHFNQPMVMSAAAVITVCADVNRMNKWCSARNADAAFNNSETFVSAMVDAVIVAQNIAVAAEDEGLGICFLGTTTYNPDQIIKALNLPRGVFPVTTLTVGYPDENPGLTERLPLEAVVHYESYSDYSLDDINNFYAAKESNPANQSFVAENSKENLAQVFSEVRYPRQSNEAFSKILDASIARQFL